MIGVYAIRNNANGKVYIGESLNISRRWKYHKEELNNGTHHNYKLQEDWNIYGEASFTFKVIEEFNFPNNVILDKRKLKIVLLCREYYHIKENNSLEQGYNIECSLRDSYYNVHKDFDKQKCFGDDFQQLVEDNSHLFNAPYNIDDIIKFAAIDTDDVIKVKSKEKWSEHIHSIAIGKMVNLIKKTFNIHYTKAELFSVMVENGWIEKDNNGYKATDIGITSGNVIQEKYVRLTNQGRDYVINQFKVCKGNGITV